MHHYDVIAHAHKESYLVLLASIMAAMISYTVFSQHRRRTLVAWRIAGVNPPSATFRSFFNGHVRDQLGESSGGEATDLADVFVGQSKDHLDCVDSDLVIADVASVFGRFVKYTVGQPEAVGHRVEFYIGEVARYTWAG